MIVVKIELHSATTGRVSLLGTVIIANDGTAASARRGNYAVKIAHKADAGELQKIWSNPLRTGRVESYPRLSYNVWRLVPRAIASAFSEESVTLPDVDLPEIEKV